MIHRLFGASLDVAHRRSGRTAAFVNFIRDTFSGFLTTMHHTVMILGIAAIAAWGLLFVRPDILDHLKALSPFADATEETVVEVPPLTDLMAVPSGVFTQAKASGQVGAADPAVLDSKALGNARQQQWVTEWLSKRYRVAADATNMLVSATYLTAAEYKLDPLLILAVMAVESRFNPFAESPVGAQGLMQVMSKVHHDKFEELGGVKAALNPVANIRVGAQILKEYVRRGGSVEAGLKLYVGAADLETDSGYGARVLAEYERLKEVSRGKKVPVYATTVSAPAAKPQRRPDAETEAAANAPAPAKQDKAPELASLS